MSGSDNPVKTLYNALAPFYTKIVAMDDNEIATVLSKLPRTPGRALDLGCGVGRLAVPLARAGWSIRGFDLSPGMLAEAGAYAREMEVVDRVSWTLADFSDPANLLDGPVDLVLAIGSLFHVTDDAVLARLLDAIAARLRPGGLFVMDMETDQSAWVSEPDLHDVAGDGGTLRIRKNGAAVERVGRTWVDLTVEREGVPAATVRMQTRWAEEEEFRARLGDAGFEVLEAQPDWGAAGESGLLYTARRL